jgi:MinD-like ATPase involved in chromosome partitioning or flagellar assembly
MTFVSFKGGAGRSVTLANVAFQLATSGMRVGVVDFDIEGGGLHKVFELEDNPLDSIQHFLMDKEDYQLYLGDTEPPDYEDDKVFLDRLVIDVKKHTNSLWAREAPPAGEIYLVQAKPDARATGFVDTGMSLFFRFNRLLNRLGDLADLDIVLVDCRSGISNLALPGLAYCDLTVVLLRWGTQHRYGTQQLVSWYTQWLARGEMSKPVFVVLSNYQGAGAMDEHALGEFCATALEGVPCGFDSIPLLEYLITHDVILWGESWKEQQERYMSLAKKLMRAVKDA